MAEGIARLEKVLADLEVAVADGREVVRQLHEAVKDAKGERKQLEMLVTDTAHGYVNDVLEREVKSGLEQYAETVKKAMDAAVAHVGEEFDKLAAAYLQGQDGEHLHRLVQERERRTRRLGN